MDLATFLGFLIGTIFILLGIVSTNLEMENLAWFLNQRGIRLVRAKTVPLWVPANSEIVIEGYVETGGGLIGYEPRRDAGGGLR